MAAETDLPRRRGCVWVVNLALLVGLTAWILMDPGFERFGDRLMQVFAAWSTSGPWKQAFAAAGKVRLVAFGGIVAVSGATLVRMTVGLVRGSPPHRTLRRWFIFVALLGMWITLGRFWRDLGWTGKSLRVRDEIAAIQPVAERLHGNWPVEDGNIAGLGAFSAYPPLAPTMLLLLTPPELSMRERAISAVERTASGALCFELSGSERGDWLQWHPEGSRPVDFHSGLDVPYRLVKFRQVTGRWYLARYNSAWTTGQ
ncbi:MAG: hypothetical protein WDZ59_12685 [Pirellulales bacterium]